jgi:hypothetical protein
MQEATIRAQLAAIRSEFKRVEAEYLVLRDLTQDYVRWLGILGLEDEPDAHDAAHGHAGGVADGERTAEQSVDDTRPADEAVDREDPLEPPAVMVIEIDEVDRADRDASSPEPALNAERSSSMESSGDGSPRGPESSSEHSDIAAAVERPSTDTPHIAPAPVDAFPEGWRDREDAPFDQGQPESLDPVLEPLRDRVPENDD